MIKEEAFEVGARKTGISSGRIKNCGGEDGVKGWSSRRRGFNLVSECTRPRYKYFYLSVGASVASSVHQCDGVCLRDGGGGASAEISR